MKSDIQKTFYNPAQNAVAGEAENGMNGEMDRMEKWFWEAQNTNTLYVKDIPRERSKPFVKIFLRDNIPNVANVCVPVDRVSGTITGFAFVELLTGVNVEDVLKQVKGLKMGSRRLKIKELSDGGFDNYRPSTPLYQPSAPLNSPIRMQSPVFEK